MNRWRRALATTADTLRPGGDVLVFWDCYDPHDVQVRMYEEVSDPLGGPAGAIRAQP